MSRLRTTIMKQTQPMCISCLSCAMMVTSMAGPAKAGDQGRRVNTLNHVMKMRERVEPINRMLKDRLENLLPKLMSETGIDMWLVINREYAEDPVYLTLVPEPVFAARRTTILVFFNRGPGEGVERLVVSRYSMPGFYESDWDPRSRVGQWERLAEVVAERNPKRIGINTSRGWAFGDGLTLGLRERMLNLLSPIYQKRLVSAEKLCVRWLETRTELEMEVYPHIVAIARAVIAEAFSSKVITPGATTTADVYWYIRQRFEDLNLNPWFQPYVNIQRRGQECRREDPFCGKPQGVIQRGDVLHTDVGINYLRLATDTQEMAYVLRLGEDDVPADLKRAMAFGNQMQDFLTAEFATGRTGNEILETTLDALHAEGILATIYSHPIGFHGHAAGPTIGMWDNQGKTDVQGEWVIHANTAYAIEGNVKVQIPAWDSQWLQIKLEQSAFFNGQEVVYLAGRQTQWHIIR